MKLFVASVLALVATVSGHAEVNMQPASSSQNSVNQFADARDSYGAPAAPLLDSYNAPPSGASGFSSAWDPPSTSYPAFQPVSGAYNAPVGGLGLNGQLDVGFPGQGFLNTALTVVFGLVGFSLLLQLLTKIMAAPFIADLFDQGRSLDQATIMDYTNMAINGIQKAQEFYENLQ